MGAPKLRVRLLGQFEVYRDGNAIEPSEWQTVNNKTLLKALLTKPGHTFSVDTLVEYLWPGGDPNVVISNLRGRVSQLRRILEPDLGAGHQGQQSTFIQTEGGGYAFDPTNCWIDTECFKARITQAKDHDERGESEQAIALYRSAIELYQGDFLPEDNDHDWVLAVRDELKRTYLQALTSVITLFNEQGRDGEAIAFCETGLAADPYNEQFYRHLMRCHNRCGNLSKALSVYEECRHRLRTVLGIEPSAATQELYQQIQHEAGTASAVADLEQDLAEQRQALDGASDPAERMEILHVISGLLDQLGRQEERRQSLQEALALAHQLGETDQAGQLHCALAASSAKDGQLEAARACIGEALQCYHQIADHTGQAQAYITLGSIEHQAGQWAAARQYFERALHLASGDDTQTDSLRLDAYSWLGKLAHRQGQPEHALDLLDTAYYISKKLHTVPTQAYLLLRLGAIHYRVERHGEAWIHWERGQELAQQAGDATTESKCLNNLALLLSKEGRPTEALSVYQRIIELQESHGESQLLADVWNNIGTIYDQIGQQEHAYDAYERSLHHSQAVGDRLGVAMEQINVAGIYIQWGQYAQAEALLESAFPVLEENADWWWVTQALIRYGWLYQQRTVHTTAIPLLERAADLAEECEFESAYIQATKFLSYSLLKHGNAERAAAQADATTAMMEQATPGYYLMSAHYYLFLVFAELGQRDRAWHHLDQAYREVVAYADQLDQPEHRSAFFANPWHQAIVEAHQRWQGG